MVLLYTNTFSDASDNIRYIYTRGKGISRNIIIGGISV